MQTLSDVHWWDDLPDPQEEVVLGVRWGRPEWIGCPAFWLSVVRHSEDARDRFGTGTKSLMDVLTFCLLGGYGVTAEMNVAAFERLREDSLLAAGVAPTPSLIERSLERPLRVGTRMVRYRYPRQRAGRISNALATLAAVQPPIGAPLALRDWLLTLPGVGPKTAAWVVRDLTGSDEVAILDVHVVRAGCHMGLFGPDVRLPRDYSRLEAKFLQFAGALGVRASILDVVIWSEMRDLGSNGLGPSTHSAGTSSKPRGGPSVTQDVQ